MAVSSSSEASQSRLTSPIGRAKARSIEASGPAGSSRESRDTHASGPDPRSSRSKTLPPSSMASRGEGGRVGRLLSRSLAAIAAAR